MNYKDRGRGGSITLRFLRLVAVAFLASALFFLLLNRTGTALLNAYFRKTSYMQQENNRRIEAFRNYVAENAIEAGDLPRLSQWTRQQEVVWMQIYRDHILLFDSQYPYMEANAEFHVEGRYYDWDSYRTIEFADGEAQVFLTGMYTYQFFNGALLAEFCLSFLLFTGIIMAGVHSAMKYIRKLSGEIRILESGNLDYPITVSGNDEMAVLARGLDSMRQSIRNQMRQEAELIRLNQSMITSLSHDLRTPLTSLLLYTELLEKSLPTGDAQAHARARKIEEKTLQIRDMADRILEYSKQARDSGPDRILCLPIREALSPPLAEALSLLGEQGFQIRAALDWGREFIRINPDELPRILDNIVSNLFKYASRNAPIRVCLYRTGSLAGFSFENTRRTPDSAVESNRIGLSNIRTMMEGIGGECQILEDETTYCIRILFPLGQAREPDGS